MTLTLRKGTSTHLKDVETITSEAKDGTFTWTPGDNVKEGETYAFQVSQGGQVNYSALLKAGVGAPKAETTGATHAKHATTEATAATGTTTGATTTGTNTQTTMATMATEIQTTSKPLISSSASGSPSATPSSTTVSSTVTNGPMMTDTNEMNGKEASETGTTQSGMASVPSLSREIVLGALGLFVYLVQ